MVPALEDQDGVDDGRREVEEQVEQARRVEDQPQHVAAELSGHAAGTADDGLEVIEDLELRVDVVLHAEEHAQEDEEQLLDDEVRHAVAEYGAEKVAEKSDAQREEQQEEEGGEKPARSRRLEDDLEEEYGDGKTERLHELAVKHPAFASGHLGIGLEVQPRDERQDARGDDAAQACEEPADCLQNADDCRDHGAKRPGGARGIATSASRIIRGNLPSRNDIIVAMAVRTHTCSGQDKPLPKLDVVGARRTRRNKQLQKSN